jgi:hypothetical protein
MDLYEYAKENWLYIDTLDGGRRNIAEIFPTGTGIVFFDVWWYGSDGHPVHRVNGKVTKSSIDEGSWIIDPGGKDTVSIIYTLTKDDNGLWEERQAWEEYKKTAKGKNATTERSKMYLS